LSSASKSSGKPRGQSSRSRQQPRFQQQLHSWVKATDSDPVVQEMRESKRVALDAISSLWRIAKDPWRSSSAKRHAGRTGEIDKAGLARFYLATIAKLAKDSDALFKQAGRPDDGKTTRRMLDMLTELASGETRTNQAVDKARDDAGRVSDERFKQISAVQRQELKRFCEKVKTALLEHFWRPFDNKTVAFCTPERVTDAMIRNTFRSWPGVRFPDDIPAFRKAVERHANAHSRKRQ